MRFVPWNLCFVPWNLRFVPWNLRFTMGSCLSVPASVLASVLASVPASVPASVTYLKRSAKYAKERFKNVVCALKVCVQNNVLRSDNATSIEADLNYEYTDFEVQINNVWYIVSGVSPSNGHGHIIELESVADGGELFSSLDAFADKIKSLL